jgi:transcription-repair coupling factor (superfamily II helicase)
LSVARQFERENPDILVNVKQHTIESINSEIEKDLPDIISFGTGINITGMSELDIKANAYVKEDYISSERGKMDAYKNIAEIKSEEDKERVIKSLKDNYGEIPKEVLTLIDIAVLKQKAISVGGIKIVISNREGKIYLENLNSLKDGKIAGKIPKYSKKVSLSFDKNPILSFSPELQNSNEYINLMVEFLTF